MWLCVCFARGLKQSEAELCFLNTARTLELYGVELHAAMVELSPGSNAHVTSQVPVCQRLTYDALCHFLSSQDTNNTSLMVGLASSGVAMFRNMICSSFFPWWVILPLITSYTGIFQSLWHTALLTCRGNIIKISFKRKRFLIHLKRKHVSPSPVHFFYRSCYDLLLTNCCF